MGLLGELVNREFDKKKEERQRKLEMFKLYLPTLKDATPEKAEAAWEAFKKEAAPKEAHGILEPLKHVLLGRHGGKSSPQAQTANEGGDRQPDSDEARDDKSQLLAEPGNISLVNRPKVKNSDGTSSTVRTITIEDDGKTILIPTVVNGEIVSNEDAIKHYRETGEHMGKFGSEEAAEEYDKQLHNRMGWDGAPGSDQEKWQDSARPQGRLGKSLPTRTPDGSRYYTDKEQDAMALSRDIAKKKQDEQLKQDMKVVEQKNLDQHIADTLKLRDSGQISDEQAQLRLGEKPKPPERGLWIGPKGHKIYGIIDPRDPQQMIIKGPDGQSHVVRQTPATRIVPVGDYEKEQAEKDKADKPTAEQQKETLAFDAYKEKHHIDGELTASQKQAAIAEQKQSETPRRDPERVREETEYWKSQNLPEDEARQKALATVHHEVATQDAKKDNDLGRAQSDRRAAASPSPANPAAMKSAAMFELIAGDKPTFGLGKSADRDAYNSARNELLAQIGPQDVAALRSAYKSGSAELTALMKRTGLLDSVESAFQYDIANAREASASVPRSDIRRYNDWKQFAQADFTDNPKLAQLRIAAQTAANQYARIMVSSGSGSVTTDGARAHAEELLSAAMANGTFDAALEQMDKEAKNMTKGLGEATERAKQGITRLGQQTNQTTPPAPIPDSAKSKVTSSPEGHETKFGNGQVWVNRGGQAVYLRTEK